jgi:hypothetical protein
MAMKTPKAVRSSIFQTRAPGAVSMAGINEFPKFEGLLWSAGAKNDDAPN